MDTSGSVPAMHPATPSPVPAPGFKTARRGFDQQQVLEYIKRLTVSLQTVQNLEGHLRSEAEQAHRQRDAALRERDAIAQQRDAALRERDGALRDRTSAETATYEQVSGRVTDLLMGLDREVEAIRAETRAEAERMLADARTEADRLRREGVEARTAAMEAARRMREDSERSLADLTSQRNGMLEALRRTCSESLDVIGALAASIDERIDDGKDEVVIPELMPDPPAAS
jgi:peptidoglycan DL-endopeptidase RipA